MARKTGRMVVLRGSVACGASDATNLILGTEQVASVALVTPMDGMEFVGAEVTQQVAGTGTGTFSLQFSYGGTPTVIGNATSATFIDADAVAGTVHGFADCGGNKSIPAGQQLKVATVKTGTVSGNATLSIDLIFRLDSLA